MRREAGWWCLVRKAEKDTRRRSACVERQLRCGADRPYHVGGLDVWLNDDLIARPLELVLVETLVEAERAHAIHHLKRCVLECLPTVHERRDGARELRTKSVEVDSRV